jgi:hypothetical protein
MQACTQGFSAPPLRVLGRHVSKQSGSVCANFAEAAGDDDDEDDVDNDHHYGSLMLPPPPPP